MKEKHWPLSWNMLGKAPSRYTLQLDRRTIAENIQGEKYVLDLSHTRPGKHRVTLIANGAHTIRSGAGEAGEEIATPLPVTSAIEFSVEYTHTPGLGETALN